MNPGAPGARALGDAAEAIILALAMRGDDAAYGELVRRRQSRVRQLLRRLSGDPTLADDLAQQVFLQAWRTLRQLRSTSAFGAWLRRMAVNTWLQHIRSRPPETPSLSACEDTADFVHIEVDVARATGLSVQLDLDHALATLPSAQRLCVVLAYGEGMSHAEISAATALPLGTVKSHITRGLTQLRTRLPAYQHDGDADHE